MSPVTGTGRDTRLVAYVRLDRGPPLPIPVTGVTENRCMIALEGHRVEAGQAVSLSLGEIGPIEARVEHALPKSVMLVFDRPLPVDVAELLQSR